MESLNCFRKFLIKKVVMYFPLHGKYDKLFKLFTLNTRKVGADCKYPTLFSRMIMRIAAIVQRTISLVSNNLLNQNEYTTILYNDAEMLNKEFKYLFVKYLMNLYFLIQIDWMMLHFYIYQWKWFQSMVLQIVKSLLL